MGLSSSKSKTKTNMTTDPSKYARPYITDAGSTLRPGYDAAVANNATLMPRVNDALDYSQGVMNGDYLNGNPHLQGVIDSTNRDLTDSVSGRFEGAGRYGSGNYAGVLARALADNENKLRYADYAQERAYQNAAPGQLMGEVGVSAALPQAAGNTYAEAVRNLMGNYTNTNGTTQTTQSQAIGPMILSAMANAAQAAAMASDERLKTNIVRLGDWDDQGDGLGAYEWNWKSAPNGERVRGVIAQEVEKLRPWAHVPNFIGQFAGVNYAALGGR
jgi:hypothetical protein